MPYSLEVLIVNRMKPVEITFDTEFAIEWEGGRFGDIRLKKTWPAMSCMPGIWCNIVKKGEVYFLNTSLVFETDFDERINQDQYYWIEDEKRKEAITPFEIKEKYFNDIKNLVTCLVHHSPDKIAMILPLYEKGRIEIIQGPIPLSKYFDLVKQKRVPFNVCTIVQD